MKLNKLIWIFAIVLISFAYAELQPGKLWINGVFISYNECIDGTLYGKCSSEKPKYCDNGELINSCQNCGCPEGKECQTNGNCVSCIEGWKCLDSYNKAYQNTDCSWEQNTYCEAGCEDGECKEESLCKELIENHNNVEENRINIVFIGVNVENTDKIKEYARVYVSELFDNNEPFTSNNNKFNVWYVNEVGQVKTYNEGNWYYGSEANNEISRLTQYCLFQNKYEVGIVGWQFRSNANFGGSMRLSIKNEVKKDTFVHELGHSFGLLYDEYSYKSVSKYSSSYENCDGVESIACPKWCSGSAIPIEEIEEIECLGTDQVTCMVFGKPCFWIDPNDPIGGWTGCVNRIKFCKSFTDVQSCNSAKNSYWKGSSCIWLNDDFYNIDYFKSNCLPTYSGDINIGTECMEGTGCYQTCGNANWFKSSVRSKMRTVNYPFFIIHERALCKRIKESIGIVEGIYPTIFNIQ